MQEAGLFVTLAEIAGVFVGFGALIAVRSGAASDAREVSYIRWVLSIGVWVIVVALAPVTIGAYDIGERGVWLVCSLVALAGAVGVWATNYRTPEWQREVAPMSRADIVRGTAINMLLVVPMLAALILVVLGPFPDQEPALYLTAVVLGLFLAALTLLWLVFEHRRPQAPATDEAEQPAE
jgi:Na+-driven multidrug efflux pump